MMASVEIAPVDEENLGLARPPDGTCWFRKIITSLMLKLTARAATYDCWQ
jgi:hypothetical protein